MPAIAFWRFLVSNCQDLNYLSLVWFSGIVHNRFFVQVIHRESTIEFFLLWLDQKLFSDSWITSNVVSWSKILTHIDRFLLCNHLRNFFQSRQLISFDNLGVQSNQSFMFSRQSILTLFYVRQRLSWGNIRIEKGAV